MFSYVFFFSVSTLNGGCIGHWRPRMRGTLCRRAVLAQIHPTAIIPDVQHVEPQATVARLARIYFRQPCGLIVPFRTYQYFWNWQYVVESEYPLVSYPKILQYRCTSNDAHASSCVWIS